MAWMAWTPITAVFFSCIILMLIGMGIWQAVSPTVPRRGFLPLTTTRGDRLFIGLLGAAYVHLGWMAFTDAALWIGSIIALVWLIVVMRWG
jgi:predicted small integral membrane protein